MNLKKQIREIRAEIKKAFSNVQDLDELERLRMKYLGSGGKIPELYDEIDQIDSEKKASNMDKKTDNLKKKAKNLHQQQKEKIKEEN